MKKAMTNYWVDLITGVAFLFCAVTGLIRLFPEATVSMSSAGQPVILGIGTSVWRVVHDWSAVIMVVGVGVHLALHLRWVVCMTGKIVRGKCAAKPAKAAARQATPQATRLAAMQAAPVAANQAGAAGSLARLEALGSTSRQTRDSQRRYTRKGFLAAAGVVGAATLFAGWSLLGRSDESAATSLAAQSADETEGSGSTYMESDDSAASTAASTSSDDGAASTATASTSSDASASGAASTSTSSARVVVDSQACTGCGNCVQACAYGVFTMSGGKAVVQNADACQLCGRCVRSCAPGAITLNA